MKITRVGYERLNLRLSQPYTIAYETIDHTVNFILKVETDTEIVGYGCGAPDKIVTGETADEVEASIENTIIPLLKGKDPFTYAHILVELKAQLGRKSSSLTMVDMALHDLISKKAGVPLYRFLGGFQNSIPTSITIGILPLEETLEQAREFVGRGFFILKVKGGHSLEEDIEKMTRLHQEFPGVTLRFDGNQGYSVLDSVTFVKATGQIGIEIFEQPTQREKEERLGEVMNQVDIPVMADESLKTLTDAFRLAQNERVDMVNIKLMKVGGILEAMHINSVAKAAGIESMIGCNDESALGISAGLHFALSRPNVRYADLDGHLDVVDDPFKGLFHLREGVLYPTEAPGLGVINYR
ncbi:mandelate racemase/muconate lactonizing enzyme family protein [Pseudozobellia thermophila]|uniref:Dipeptide epimerase n=1 Tax=Pseudozobellia thermophila TaxID=192903 RepID=A0A1M6BAJ2_9FLAO|nr:dipeptide epimerase [Pseudozobellia thermophila]SHI45732.1 L-alanine-DL-glutamate epimerase [Pseudozobellia thermophila]